MRSERLRRLKDGTRKEQNVQMYKEEIVEESQPRSSRKVMEWAAV